MVVQPSSDINCHYSLNVAVLCMQCECSAMVTQPEAHNVDHAHLYMHAHRVRHSNSTTTTTLSARLRKDITRIKHTTTSAAVGPYKSAGRSRGVTFFLFPAGAARCGMISDCCQPCLADWPGNPTGTSRSGLCRMVSLEFLWMVPRGAFPRTSLPVNSE